jgi:preprotein translocase subunit SecG
MSFLIGLLSFVLFLVCLFLGLLVLIQLPKKEAGMGQAFGGAATDALFGAGSGNALTQMTKYAAGAFLILCLVISVLGKQAGKAKTESVRQKLAQTAPTTPTPAPALGGAVIPSTAIAPALPMTTNAVKKAATNAVAPAK